ncbi:hypothetical protein [Geothrix sp. PMB-07]|uniref:hypothetical protein n=1 Tax=Geothrix sp. PMB-07 TaxID=3068640 RepID=UPI002741DE78|nr:hypothetical protein [Geothrix sp. PMB-07]WLT32811.1 hypothetical protein Q9293_05620 [Geothrix sp. PMB-07]
MTAHVQSSAPALRFLAALLCVAVALACSGHSASAPALPPPPPPAAVTFSIDIQPTLLLPYCGSATSGCHGQSPLPQGFVRFDVSDTRNLRQCYDELKAYPLSLPGWEVVKPGDSAHSLLYDKLASGQENRQPVTGHPMPPNAQLDPRFVTLVRTWIDQGAPF